MIWLLAYFDAGMDGAVGKPLQLPELVATIKKLRDGEAAE